MGNNTKAAVQGGKTAKHQTLIEGALILTVGVALAKLIGAICKSPLANIIGEAGMGYYSSAYNLYLPFFTLASAGFPAALSRQVAESVTLGRYKDALKVRRIARNIFLLTGTLSFIGMVIVGFVLTQTNYKFSIDPNAIYAILAMCPSVFLCCVMGAYRGYNEGLRNMIPTATSQVIEAIGKLVVGLSAAVVIVKIGENKFLSAMDAAGPLAGSGMVSVNVYGTECHSLSEALAASYPFAAAGALLGITLGSGCALLYLMIRFKLKGIGIAEEEIRLSPEPRATKDIIKTFLAIGIPIALGVLAQNFTQLIDSITVQGQIKSLSADGLRQMYGDGLSEIKDEGIANFLWGVYNYGITLYNLVPYLTQAFGTSALPTLAAAWIVKDREKIK
ncbi:MAG: oligosaccharide flippase family protein, partial [Clostridia bacterium]|nr:oligosaccharide flippase family protein [Clostridia bacterium]